MRPGIADHALGRGMLAFAVVISSTGIASAQAWAPPAGFGAIGVVYQTIDNTGHRLTDGSLLEGYDSVSRGILLEVDYALTDRFSLSLGLPHVFAKYVGPLPSFSGHPIDECHCWNHGWQDFGLTARYNLVNGSFALTPSVSLGLPSHDYGFFGESVIGRNLKEMRIAVAAGQQLAAISPRLAVQGNVTYAFVQKVLDIPNNRTNAAIQTSFGVTSRLSTRVAFSWQRSHGGLRGTAITTMEQFEQFDRLIRDNSFHVGAGATYSLPIVDVFFSYLHYVSGTDTHAGRAITAGISWPFLIQ
jgi:hypothetical protein